MTFPRKFPTEGKAHVGYTHIGRKIHNIKEKRPLKEKNTPLPHTNQRILGGEPVCDTPWRMAGRAYAGKWKVVAVIRDML